MVNIEFLVILYFCSMFVDWIFQWKWQANNKSKWKKTDDKHLSLYALMSHSFIYAFLTTLSTLCIVGDSSHFLLVFLVLLVSHTIIDTRILVKYIMKFKGLTNDEIYDYNSYGFMHIGIDHRLHEAVLLGISIIV